MIKLSEEQKMVYDDLSMPEKVAIFLIQLGEDATTSVFSHMEIDVITEISRYIAMAKNVDRSVATAVLEEFYTLLQSNQYIKSGGLEYAKEILFRTFGPEIANKILEKLTKSMENNQNFVWRKLNHSNLQTLLPKSTHKPSLLFWHTWILFMRQKL